MRSIADPNPKEIFETTKTTMHPVPRNLGELGGCVHPAAISSATVVVVVVVSLDVALFANRMNRLQTKRWETRYHAFIHYSKIYLGCVIQG